ncbi:MULTISPECIES: hypothetical protein [unclassified Rathayibacter]|uniref:hypothetical protein n=1 Tax=unclassified Rathayibacter TaxID=2609250 RepID=UPI000FBFD3A9|nr:MULTISPECIES: hypothetical protein [unclassified Rathayibacter]ROP44379.1 hypothetical protein EDF45_3845 [Rathayibacter sp. PhB186]ROS46953.1 hypothetical protein EDF44_3854 [Rathayibacter sp. PhB185]
MTPPPRPLPWFAKPAPKIRFVRDLAAVDAVRVAKSTYAVGFRVEFELEPDGVPRRKVSIDFSRNSPNTPRVHVDGPEESPHRYSDGTLCMWYPGDPPSAKWLPRDGAAQLITRIGVHLIKEQWFRQSGEWIGPEITHERHDSANDPRET